MSLTKKDLERLNGVRGELIDVASAASGMIPIKMEGVKFFITEGLRTLERQRQLVAAGASRTMSSNHLTGRAFDFGLLVGGKARWDWPLFMQAGEIIKEEARKLGVRIVWGGDWVKFRDGPHVELAKDWP